MPRQAFSVLPRLSLLSGWLNYLSEKRYHFINSCVMLQTHVHISRLLCILYESKLAWFYSEYIENT